MNEFAIYTKKFINYCTVRNFSPHTIRVYTYDLKSFMDFLKESPVPTEKCVQVTKHTLNAYMESLGDIYSVKTVRRRMACLRSFFNYLEYEEVIQDSPFAKFKIRMKDPFRIPTTLSLQEMGKILDAAYSAHPLSISEHEDRRPTMADRLEKKAKVNSLEFLWFRDLAILELLFAGGLRVSELCSLKRSSMSSNYHALRIQGKGNKERTIYLENKEVLRALERYLDLREAAGVDSEYIFLTKYSHPLSTQAVRNLVTKYTKEAGINKNITPHVFRHTFASLLLEEGVDIKYIQEFLGHSSITTTQIYLHTTKEHKRLIMSTKHPREKLCMKSVVYK